LTTVRGLDQSRRSARDAERALSVERAPGRAPARVQVAERVVGGAFVATDVLGVCA